LNIDSRGGLGYMHIRRYIFAPPGGTLLLRRLHKFVKIEGTDMYYALNTPSSVIQYGNNYYCCDNGVWFISDYATGPWRVCVAVPQAIYTIPPSCPIYNVKYVYVYASTPDVVYVGYTPGYVGCYVHGGTVVYGTGYVYHGWHHVHYYPRPATWGVAVRYNPNTGNWAIGVGHRGWYGGGFRFTYADIDIDRNININRNVYAGRGGVPGPGGRYDPRGVRDPRGVADPRGVRDPRGVADPRGARDPRGVADPRGAADPRGLRDPRGPADSRGAVGIQPVERGDRPNNVFADRNGSIHRKTESGWQQRDRSGWSENKRSTTQLDRESSARQRGTDRTNHFDRSQSSGSRSGSFGGSRSGGFGGSQGGRSGGRRR